MTIDFTKLAEPFPADDIEWRIGRAGKNANGVWATAFAYVTNRAIMARLDDVCGPQHWRNEFTTPPNAAPGSAALCTLYIKIDGEWVGKSDGADNTDMEATKGGLSDSMKRAAVQWGIGRYLYQLEEGWVTAETDKPKDKDNWRYQAANEKKGLPAFYWQPPKLPPWALPGKQEPKVEPPAPKSQAKKIAAEHGMTTGDKVKPPAKPKAEPKSDAPKAMTYDQLKKALDGIPPDDPNFSARITKAEDVIYEQLKAGHIDEKQRLDLSFIVMELQKAHEALDALTQPAAA